MTMRVRDLQQYLNKFTLGQKGTAVSDCPIFIETQKWKFGRDKKNRDSRKFNNRSSSSR